MITDSRSAPPVPCCHMLREYVQESEDLFLSLIQFSQVPSRLLSFRDENDTEVLKGCDQTYSGGSRAGPMLCLAAQNWLCLHARSHRGATACVPTPACDRPSRRVG